jgi:hypothetical protein
MGRPGNGAAAWDAVDEVCDCDCDSGGAGVGCDGIERGAAVPERVGSVGEGGR